MTHTQPWGSTPLLMKSSHWIKSSFHFYLNFPMMSHCVSFYYSFSFWFIIWFIMLSWKGTFWNFPLTHWWAIAYWSQKCCLVVLDSPHVYKEAVLPQRKDNQVQVLFLAQLSSARYLTLQSWLQHQDLSASLLKVSTTLITSSECVFLTSSSLLQCKVSKIKYIFREIPWIFLTLH